MEIEFECEIPLQVSVWVKYKPGTPAQVTRLHPNGLPGDPEEVKIKEVCLWRSTEEGPVFLNIQNFLSPVEMEVLMDVAADRCREEMGL